MECVFCDIVAGQVKASVVYEDETTMAFVDRRQPSWPHGGHVLVVPKQHVEFLYDLPVELSDGVMRTAVPQYPSPLELDDLAGRVRDKLD